MPEMRVEPRGLMDGYGVGGPPPRMQAVREHLGGEASPSLPET